MLAVPPELEPLAPTRSVEGDLTMRFAGQGLFVRVSSGRYVGAPDHRSQVNYLPQKASRNGDELWWFTYEDPSAAAQRRFLLDFRWLSRKHPDHNIALTAECVSPARCEVARLMSHTIEPIS